MTSTIKVNNIQNQCGQNIINENSNTITIGASGDTIALASGASQSGFGRAGSVNWQTGSIKTGNFTAADGEGYFVDTSSGGVTASLPAGSAGAIVAFADYTRTFGNNTLTVSPNGSDKIGGFADDLRATVSGQALTLVFVDSTEGWINVQNAEDTETGTPPFIGATGGTITTSGNDTIHTFTGPGTFAVTRLADCAANNEVSYMVVAGGGGAGNRGGCTGETGGGGGAGGFRETKSPVTPYTASPLDGQPSAPNRITVSVTNYPITVGAGGNGSPGSATPGVTSNTRNGNNSIFSTITATGGGGGGQRAFTTPSNGIAGGAAGGSGGGGTFSGPTGDGEPGGAGNTPSVSPPQGNTGGNGPGPGGAGAGGGGGGATAAGANRGPQNGVGGAGGAGATTSISGSPTAYAGGGGGGGNEPSYPGVGVGGAGGAGGGGQGGDRTPTNPEGVDGTVNTGGGGGGGSGPGGGGAGGSGVVIIRYKSS